MKAGLQNSERGVTWLDDQDGQDDQDDQGGQGGQELAAVMRPARPS